MKVSFVLLAHEEPESLRLLIETLLASGSDVYVHHDAKCPTSLEKSSRNWQLERFTGSLFHARRVKVEWGEWSIVQATLNCLNLARKKGYNADYFMLLSGSCMPIKPIQALQNFLELQSDIDFIEVVNAWEKRWITRGIQQERWEKHHYINWRTHPTLFDLSLKLQKKLNVKRKLPVRHTPFMGSQWWCLRSTTINTILSLLDRHPALARFYRRTWVPDELFFQTMVGNLVSLKNTSAQILTRYKFNSLGVPRVYYDDDLPELLAEDSFFARKISHRSKKLRQSLSDICALPYAEYQRLLSDQDNKYAVDFRKLIVFKRELRQVDWFSLAKSAENEFDYIKSIPNPMIVVLSASKHIRRQALAELKVLPDSVVYGDILDGKDLDFGEATDVVAGYRTDTPILAHYKWHLFLGELAFHSKGKALVFSLGEDPLPYLNVLRWKVNLTVVVLDGKFSEEEQNEHLKSIYLNSQVSHIVGNNAHCKFARLSSVAFKKTTQALRTSPCSVDHFWYRLSDLSSNFPSENIQKKANDKYDFLKSIPNPMIIIYAAEKEVSDSILNHIQKRLDFTAYHDLFEQVPPDRKEIDWHYYLCDVAHASQNNIIAFAIDPKRIFYVEALRWKKNLAVIVINDKMPSSLLMRGLEGLQEIWLLDTEIDIARKEINGLLIDKHCQVYYPKSDDPQYIDNAVEIFIGQCRAEAALQKKTDANIPRYSPLTNQENRPRRRFINLRRQMK